MTEFRPPHPDQADLVAFLADPASHGGANVRRVDTHLSHVFITETRAYKLKRAVDLGFVDYSTRDRRRWFCRQELAVNQAWAARLYLAVEPVRRGNGGFTIGDGADPVVDWLVVMRPFPARDQADRLLDRGELGRDELRGFADRLAALHREGEAGTAAPDWPRAVLDQLGRDLGERGRPWHGAAVDTYGHHAARVAQRAGRPGRVRRCHGDLHLANLCRLDGALIGFDALEFDDRLSVIDTLYDLAFPVMDLTARGAPGLACLTLSRYTAWLDDADRADLGLLGLYGSLRAAIRSLVTGLSGRDDLSSLYLDAARAFLAPPGRPPRLVAIGGYPAAGKSTLALELAPGLAPAPGAVILRNDEIRKITFGTAPERSLPADAYTQATNQTVRDRVRRAATALLAAGRDVILDATFTGAADRSGLAALAQAQGADFRPRWLDVPAETLRARISARSGDASDADLAVLERMLEVPPPADWPMVTGPADAERHLSPP